jgi:hypothetical protein
MADSVNGGLRKWRTLLMADSVCGMVAHFSLAVTGYVSFSVDCYAAPSGRPAIGDLMLGCGSRVV